MTIECARPNDQSLIAGSAECAFKGVCGRSETSALAIPAFAVLLPYSIG